MANTYEPGIKICGVVDIDGTVNTKPVLTDNATITNIAASLTEVVLQAQNSLRRELVIHNSSNGTLYVICGTGVTTTNYTYKLSREDYVIIDTYRGQINGIFTNAVGFAMVTEKFY
jgi:hypothetical protein